MLRSGFGFALLAALLLAPLAALSGQTGPAIAAIQARPPLVPTAAFTARSGLSGMKLSPDGSRIALKAVASDGKTRLAVLDANTKKIVHNLEIPAIKQLEWINWAGNNRILVSLSQVGKLFGEEVTFTRLFVFDLTNGAFGFVGKKDMGMIRRCILIRPGNSSCS
jgi:hypothetical protein